MKVADVARALVRKHDGDFDAALAEAQAAADRPPGNYVGSLCRNLIDKPLVECLKSGEWEEL